jgi:UDP-GlcNAc:undecaprenyl-phosphate/decaprenyl-phosphate GlcNAc-1-phosphate transferase
VTFVVIYLATFLSAFFTALLALPQWTKWCLRTGLVDDPGHRKIHDQAMPLAGGLTVMTALAVPAMLAMLILWVRHRLDLKVPPLDATTTPLLAYGVHKRSLELAAIFLGAIGMLLVGLWDDKKESRPAAKFFWQFAVAALVAASGARITLFVPSAIFSFAVTILWILTVINAFNFMDNMNGLCGGLGAIGAFYFGLSAATAAVPQYLVALLAFLTCGALVGFLPNNFPRAKSFLGDSGSHLVGYLLAVLAILPHFYTAGNPHTLAVLTPLLILAVPLGDLVWVVILRWRLGKPFYVGDNNHLSHRLVTLGLSRTQAVLAIWLLAIALGALAFA